MPNVNDLHQKAMSLVDEAHLARLNGLERDCLELTEAAFNFEAEAAWALSGELELEPTRSVLFRSAASLALEIGKSREAERLISAALAGTPPDEIANELRDLLEDVYFARHLDQLTSEERLQRLFRDYNAILADNTQRLAQIVDDLKLEFTLLSNETKVLRDQVKSIRPTE